MADERFKSIKLEREAGVTFVILNRPEKRNAMSPALHREMCEALDELEMEEETKIVVVTGAGDSFSAGAGRTLLPALYRSACFFWPANRRPFSSP